METVSIIDLGSNSLKLLICNMYKNNKLSSIYEKKIQIRLSDYCTDEENNLSPLGIYKLIYVLENFKTISDSYKSTKIITVATESLRKCSNIEYILEIIKKETDISIKLLSGYEEAYLGYVSTLNTLNYSDYFLVDIGGASVEISLIRNKQFVNFVSLPFGAVPISKQFNFRDKVLYKTSIDFRNTIYKEFDKLEWLKQEDTLPTICIGGSIKTLAHIYSLNNNTDEYTHLHNLKINYDELSKINKYLCDLSYEDKINIKGLSRKRADIICGASNFINYFMDYTNSNNIIINKFGIREGIIYRML